MWPHLKQRYANSIFFHFAGLECVNAMQSQIKLFILFKFAAKECASAQFCHCKNLVIAGVDYDTSTMMVMTCSSFCVRYFNVLSSSFKSTNVYMINTNEKHDNSKHTKKSPKSSIGYPEEREKNKSSLKEKKM